MCDYKGVQQVLYIKFYQNLSKYSEGMVHIKVLYVLKYSGNKPN